MTGEQWQTVKSLFEQCLEQPPSARAAWLAHACHDPELLAEAQSLIDAHDEGTDFLEEPARAGVELVAALRPEALIGTRVGPYRLVEEIGRGGMGSVYRAVRDDHEFEIEVAIKIVGRGMDAEMLLRRFKTERQILAHLEHPYIARLLDGGTTPGGLPYFVMEYVQGIPLTDYCDRHRLGLTERLHLFRKVCEAVGYAHQNLVVHRDLKPANILVTADGTPKLLDFGIARIMNPTNGRDTGEPTVTMLRMATPAYASPEQIRGGIAGPSTDIYSLGVILYELLTGHRPYRLPVSDSVELARVISEREPTRASIVAGLAEKIERSSGDVTTIDPDAISRNRNATVEQLRKRLRGDLDNILAMALRKEAHRRYETVGQLSDDLHRHLVGLPIHARKDTLGYRASKFVARHQVGVALGVAVALLLIGTSIFAIRKAALLAERVHEDHRLASTFLVDIHDTIAKLPGSMAAREAVLARSLQYLNGLARDAGSDPAFRRSLALAYERFAELQIGVGGPGLGRSADAVDTSGKALAIRQKLAAEEPNNMEVQSELANSFLLSSYIAGRAGSAVQRMGYDRKALEIAQRVIESDARNSKHRSILARAHTSLAYGLLYEDQWEAARSHFTQALAIHSEIVAEDPRNVRAKRDLASIHYRLGASSVQSGQPARALDNLQQALALQKKLAEAEPDNSQYQSDIAASHHFLGMAHAAMSQLPDALAHFETAIKIRRAALAQDARDVRSRSMLAGTFAERSTALLRSGEAAPALESARAAVDLQQEVLDQDLKGIPTRISLAEYETRLAAAYAATKLWSDAVASYGRAVAIYDTLQSEGHLRSPAIRADAERARLMLTQVRGR